MGRRSVPRLPPEAARAPALRRVTRVFIAIAPCPVLFGLSLHGWCIRVLNKVRPIAAQWVSVPVQNGPRRVLSYFQCRQRLGTLIGVGPLLTRAIEKCLNRWRR
jgi:hypothetical protein